MNKKNVIINMLWRFAERCGSQGINFIVSIILARVLSPNEYGTVALVTVLIDILQIFVNSGFPSALIQKKEATALDFSTMFCFNILMCTVLYVGLYFAAPFIAIFYSDVALVAIIRVLGIRLLISGLLAVQNAYVQRNMQFKKYFYATLAGTVVSAVVGIAMVYNGYGVWALVGQTLTAAAINAIVLWFTSGFYPKLRCSFASLQSLFPYALRLFLADIVDKVYINFRSLIIGKVYTTTDLAYYNKGEGFPKLIINNLNASIDSVLFPAMASTQNDTIRLKAMTRRSIKTTSYLVWPCMIGLIVCAEPLIELLLTAAWLPTVPFVRLFCISYAFMPMQTANQNTLKALGRSDIYLKLQTIGKGVGIITILITMQIGVLAIAAGAVAVVIFEMLIKATPNKKMIDYGYMEQLKDILPSMLLAFFMGICVWWLQYLNLPLILVLAVQVGVGVLIYFGLSAVFKMETFMLLLELAGKGMKN